MNGATAISDELVLSNDKRVEDFFCLTREALDADNVETFFAILMEREALCSSFEQFSSFLNPASITKMLFIETKILERLENERRKIMGDIDKLSRQLKTVKAYSAKFPFPAMPAFFDQAS